VTFLSNSYGLVVDRIPQAIDGAFLPASASPTEYVDDIADCNRCLPVSAPEPEAKS
jgi:hypothetical protein